MNTLEIVKFRIGIFYSDPIKDMAVMSQIESCKEYLKNAGVKEECLESHLAISAITLWCKLEQSGTESAANHPAFVSYIVQLKYKGGDETA
jgi:hypothetical protein